MDEYGAKKNVLDKDKIVEMLLVLLIVSFIGIIGNFVGYSVPILESIPGVAIIFCVAFVSIFLTYILPFKVSYILYATIIGMYIGCKWCPFSYYVALYVDKINMLALSTVCLAFAGAGMAKDWAEFKKIGIRGILVALFVMMGTFIGSAIVAQIVLKCQNLI